MRVLKVNKENTKNILSDLLKRSPNNYDQYAGTVQGILDEIKEKGDEALFAYTEKFDKCKLKKDTIQVTEEEIKAAYEKVDDSLVEVIRKSLVNIREYHEKQKRNSWFDAKPDGTILGQKMTALASVGVYVPGGKAAYPSSVLMNIVPAKVAGVEKIVMVTPPNKDGEVTPATLVAANEAGATHIYKVGGAWRHSCHRCTGHTGAPCNPPAPAPGWCGCCAGSRVPARRPRRPRGGCPAARPASASGRNG